MKKYFILISFLFTLYACETDEQSQAFVIPDYEAESAEMHLTAKQNNAAFFYTIQADLILIDWGDASRIGQYKYPESENSNWFDIKRIEHNYAQAGNYILNIRTARPNIFSFSNSDSLANFSDITQLKLTACKSLKGLYLMRQSLKTLDLSEAENIEILNIENSGISSLTSNKNLNKLTSLFVAGSQLPNFDFRLTPNLVALSIGSTFTEQNITNLASLASLRSLAIKGNIKQTYFTDMVNDSLMLFSASKSNLEEVDLKEFGILTSITIDSCTQLKGIMLSANDSLQTLSLSNNTSLSADSLNSIFENLPKATKQNTISLLGNAGDATCNKSIATNKGWVFK